MMSCIGGSWIITLWIILGRVGQCQHFLHANLPMSSHTWKASPICGAKRALSAAICCIPVWPLTKIQPAGSLLMQCHSLSEAHRHLTATNTTMVHCSEPPSPAMTDRSPLRNGSLTRIGTDCAFQKAGCILWGKVTWRCNGSWKCSLHSTNRVGLSHVAIPRWMYYCRNACGGRVFPIQCNNIWSTFCPQVRSAE